MRNEKYFKSSSRTIGILALIFVVIGSSSVLAKSKIFNKRGPSSSTSEEACVSCLFENLPNRLFRMGKEAFFLARDFGHDVINAKINEYSDSRLAYFNQINSMMKWNRCERFYEDKSNWSKGIVHEFVTHSMTTLRTLNPSKDNDAFVDLRSICPRYDYMTQIDRGFVWALVLNAVSKFESDCNPSSRAQGVNGQAAGLLQLDLGNEKQYINAYVRIAGIENQVGEDIQGKCNRYASNDALSSLRCGITMISSLVEARKYKKSEADQAKDLSIISSNAHQVQRISANHWASYGSTSNEFVKYLRKYDPYYYYYVGEKIETARKNRKLSPGLYDRQSYWEVLRPNVREDRLRQLMIAFSAYEPCLRKVEPKEQPNKTIFDFRTSMVQRQKSLTRRL